MVASNNTTSRSVKMATELPSTFPARSGDMNWTIPGASSTVFGPGQLTSVALAAQIEVMIARVNANSDRTRYIARRTITVLPTLPSQVPDWVSINLRQQRLYRFFPDGTAVD